MKGVRASMAKARRIYVQALRAEADAWEEVLEGWEGDRLDKIDAGFCLAAYWSRIRKDADRKVLEMGETQGYKLATSRDIAL